MHKLASILFVATALVSSVFGSPVAALRLQKSWDLRVAEWNLKFKSAATPADKMKLRADLPDANTALGEMWQLIGGQLAEEWTLEPASWFLNTAYSWGGDGGELGKLYAKQIEQVRVAVEQNHLASRALMPMCVALTANADPHSLALLEKISKGNPDEKIQGAASLGCALLLGQLGDDPEIMKRRLNHLRRAIIQSIDVDFGGKKVGNLAQDQLYAIKFLSKGRTAPDLTGVDAAGVGLRLSDFKGKVVYLVFWDSLMPEHERVIKMVNEVQVRFHGKPIEIIGVCADPLLALRNMEADGLVTWRNFTDAAGTLSHQYRVTNRPFVFVLDQERNIQFSGMPGSFADLTCEALLENN